MTTSQKTSTNDVNNFAIESDSFSSQVVNRLPHKICSSVKLQWNMKLQKFQRKFHFEWIIIQMFRDNIKNGALQLFRVLGWA